MLACVGRPEHFVHFFYGINKALKLQKGAVMVAGPSSISEVTHSVKYHCTFSSSGLNGSPDIASAVKRNSTISLTSLHARHL
ncbi:unnamed protein product [Protopolystoma xenopodis]|uniref:Uncharacterized protein n=1 Tax=Protopolystoma xenopodis TaxID=117903 RepID=A0A448XME3_9PLAT|nr:unnamed protein product [Protopolystoma xenopodis]